jgi:GTPase SAR1 family protein
MNQNILLDIPSKNLLYGFDEIKRSIVDFLDKTNPRYTIGIFGEWGSGKTTILSSIYQDIKKRHVSIRGNKDALDTICIPVWFNPWRFEHEEHVVIPLILQIRQTLLKILEGLNYLPHGENLRERFNKIIGALLYGFSGKISIGIAELSYSAKDSISREDELQKTKKKDFPSGELKEIESIYFDIIEQLQSLTHIELQRRRIKIKYFIFIDDVDRCLPDRALKLLEHIKILFDMEGFVFLVGLDTRSIKSWIQKKYGIDSFISGKDYIEKLIQIPVVLPKARPDEFIKSVIKQEGLLKENEMTVLYHLSKYLPQNPRSLKRIINDYLLNKSSSDDIDTEFKFKMLIIKHRWERCYNDLMRFGEGLFKEVVKFIKENNYERDRILFSLRSKNYPSGFSFNDFKEDLNEQTKFESLFDYFEHFKDYVFDIPFRQFIGEMFDEEEISKKFHVYRATSPLNYVENFKSRY